MIKIVAKLFFAISFICSSTAFSQESVGVTKIRVATNFNQMSSNGKNIKKIKEIIEAKFPNKVKFVIEDSSKYTETQELEALDYGALDLIITETNLFSRYHNAKDFELFNLPFLFSSIDDLQKFQKSDIPNIMIDNFVLKNQTIQPLSIWFGNFNALAGVSYVKDKSSLSGKMVGVFSSEINSIVFKSFGAKDVVLLKSKADISSALTSKSINSISFFSSPLENIILNRHYESISSITTLNHTPSSAVVLVNRSLFNKVPSDIRDEIIKMVRDVAINNFSEMKEVNTRALNALTVSKIGLYSPTQEEVDVFKNSAVASHEYFLKNINQSLLVDVYRLFKK